MLDATVYDELDARLSSTDAWLARHYPGEARSRQPVHTVYVPADQFGPGLTRRYGDLALAAVGEHGPLPFDAEVTARVISKLEREPIEDLRIDFEDGYGRRPDDEEDAAAKAAGSAVASDQSSATLMVGLRCKSLEASTRRRAIRTLDIFLESLGAPPAGFVVTLPKVSAVDQVAAMVVLCGRLEAAHGIAPLRFELQVETTPAVLASSGRAGVAEMIVAAEGRCVGLHYGTYDYSTACGIAAEYQSMEHPAADYAKAVMQVAAAGTGVRVSDGSTNIVPVGSHESVRAAWDLHARLVRRSLERGFYQGWDLHPAQLPTRFGATYSFYRAAAPAAVGRLERYLAGRSAGVVDEPATARSLARFLLRGLDCGALDPADVPFDRTILESQ